MKVLIVDDEVLARDRLREHVLRLESEADIEYAQDGNEAIEKVNAGQPDVVLMDIRMPVMDGLQAASYMMSLDDPPAVIFTTAYEDHALEAFEVNAVDYLLKPVRQDRLRQAFEKAERFLRQPSDDEFTGRDRRTTRSHVSINTRGQIRLIPVKEIIYFMADSKYITVRTADARHLIEDSLTSLEKEFGDRFMRVHRNSLVSTDYMRGLEKQSNNKWMIVLDQVDELIEVSRRRLPSVRRWTRRES